MQDQIAQEKERKKELKKTVIIESVVFLIIAYYIFHVVTVYHEQQAMDIPNVFANAIPHSILTPLDCLYGIEKSALYVGQGIVTIITYQWMKAEQRRRRKHDDAKTVKGGAHWMNAREMAAFNRKMNEPYGSEDNNGPHNVICSKQIRLGLAGFKTRRNLNTLVIGGSGAGKTRFFVGPNILQYNTNLVITDPSGETLDAYGKGLEDNGYRIIVFNISDVYKGNRYNPFHYIHAEADVFILVDTLVKNTSGKGEKSNEDFWVKSEKLLLYALILYVWHTMPPQDQTFANVVRLVNMADVDENDDTKQSPLDGMFANLAKDDPDNLAVLQYSLFKKAAGKTLKSIIISVVARLKGFTLSNIQYLTSIDEMNFETFGDQKTALFVILPTADTTFNFIVSLMYSQLFMTLYGYVEQRIKYGWKVSLPNGDPLKVIQAKDEEESEKAHKKLDAFVAEIKEGVYVHQNKEKAIYEVRTKKSKQLIGWRGTKEMTSAFIEQLKGDLKEEQCQRNQGCPMHVRFMLDEFANIGQLPDFNEKLATMRKYNISSCIILQGISQIKSLYDKDWATLIANCDTKLFLGTDDEDTNKYIIEKMGKRTTTVSNESFSRNGGSESLNRDSIELLTVDMLAMQQDDECIVTIRGKRPLFDKKYELTEHPNYKYSHDHEGMYKIPVNEVAKNAQSGDTPYYMRKQLEQEKNGLDINLYTDGVFADVGDFIPKSDDEDKITAENKARREEANEAVEEAKKCDEDAKQAEANGRPDEKQEKANAVDVLQRMNVSLSMTKAEIQEQVYSQIAVQTARGKNVQFGATG